MMSSTQPGSANAGGGPDSGSEPAELAAALTRHASLQRTVVALQQQLQAREAEEGEMKAQVARLLTAERAREGRGWQRRIAEREEYGSQQAQVTDTICNRHR